VMDVSFNDDATSLVSVGGDGYLAEWSVDSSGQHDVSRLGNGQGRFFSASYWPGRNGVAVGHENGTIQFFDMAEGRTIGRAITAHDSFVQALAFSADGSRLASSLWRRCLSLRPPSSDHAVDGADVGCRLGCTSRNACRCFDGRVSPIWHTQGGKRQCVRVACL
jgi:WD40 repeat protein